MSGSIPPVENLTPVTLAAEPGSGWFDRVSRRINPRFRQIVVLGAVSAQWNLDSILIPAAYHLKFGDRLPVFLFVLFGLLLGQMCLIAAYLAWGLAFWPERLVKSLFLVMLAWFSFTIGAVSTGDSFEIGSIEQLFAIVVGTSFLGICVPFMILRVVCGSRFEICENPLLTSARSERFSRRLNWLTWLAVAVVTLFILQTKAAREVWRHIGSMSDGDWFIISLWMSFWATLSTLLAVPIIRACLGRNPTVRQLIGVGIFATIAAGAESAISVFSNQNFRNWTLGLNIGIACEIVAWSLVLRLCGYRFQLVRRRRERSVELVKSPSK